MHRTNKIPIIITASLTLLSLCYGQFTLTWIGNSTHWHYSDNWSPTLVPTAEDNVIIPGGLTNYPNLTYMGITGPKACKNMYIAPGGVLNFYAHGNDVLEVSGTWLNEGTLNPGTGTVRLVNTAACSLYSDTFYRLENNKYYMTPFGAVTGCAYLMGDVTILDALVFEYGDMDCGNFGLIGTGESNVLSLDSGHLMWGRATFTNTFEDVNFGDGTVEFNGMVNQTVPSAYDFYDLILSGSGTKTLTGDVIVGGTIYIQDGVTFQTDGCRIDLGGELFIQSGTFQMGDESILTLDGGRIRVSHGSVFSAIGSGTVDTGPIVTKHPSSLEYYQFIFDGNAAMISASHATFEYMDIMGVDIDSAAIVDHNHPLDHCTFQHGDPTSYSSALIHIDNNQDILIPYANFPEMGTANVRKEVDYGRTVFYNATGIFAGEAYEVDFYDRIDWVSDANPESPVVVIQVNDASTKLIWNTVREDTNGFPIDVESYIIYSDIIPTGSFLTIEDTVNAPDTSWIDTDIISTNPIKFYQVTAFDE